MTNTEINIGEEILNFFKMLKPLIKPPNRNILLMELWKPILENISMQEKVKVYHSFCAYEKAFGNFVDFDRNLGQNAIDYADYHSFDIESPSKDLLNVIRQQALALNHYQMEQYAEALEILKESESNLKELQNILNTVNYLQTIQEYLLVNILYATGDFEAASGRASALLEFWCDGCTGTQNQVNFPLNIEAQRPHVIHYLTDGILLCVHNVCGDNEEMIAAQLNNIFNSFNQTNISTCPVKGYEQAVQLLLSYSNEDDIDSFIPALINLFPVLSETPIFFQYYLLKKLIRLMESIDYPEHVAISHELMRYFIYLGIGRSDSLKKYKPDFIKRET